MSHPTTLIVQRWFAAFNAHALEDLLDLYAEHAEHGSPKLRALQPGTDGLIKGKTALRAWWADAFQRLPSLSYEVLHVIADDHRAFMEYLRHVDGEPDLRVGEVLVIENGLIVASRVFHG